MKKVSKILMTIGGVFHIVNGASTIISGLVMFLLCVIYFVTGRLYGAEMLAEYGKEVNAEIFNWSFTIASIIYLWIGLLCVALGIVSFIAAKIAFRAANGDDQKNFITSLVFGVLLDVKVAIVGSIFGLIALNKEENKKPDDDPVADEVIR